MSKILKLSLALIAAAFLYSAPVIAADAPAVPAAPQTAPKADPSSLLQDKAANLLDQGKADAKKQIGDALGVNKPADSAVEVTSESVTTETPRGVVQESVTTVTPAAPEAPAAPEVPAAPAK